MPSLITDLQSIARRVRPIMLDVYDREATESLLPFIAQVVQNTENLDPYPLEWWDAFPELRLWLDEKTLQRVFADTMSIEGEDFEITFAFDRKKGNAYNLVKAQDLAPKIGRGVAQGKVALALTPLRENALTYDGQDLFDTDHVHPDGSLFSNLLSSPGDFPARADAANPTKAELELEFRTAQSTLLENTLIRNSLVSATQVSSNLVAIARSQPVFRGLEDLRTKDKIGDETNTLKGAFSLLRDFKGPAGEANSWDLIHAEPGGFRPSIFVVFGQEQLDITVAPEDFNRRDVPFGVEEKYRAVAGFPQTCVRISG